ncbi:hypothetical protein PRZ48_005753 [Zasmidium cellare]|uniref:Cell wall mannoprotein PIR1-like C-terminal domain-containing protein n=1 Tax=Zasmidium cellare TaxID=395010 RepID=A0ABR0END3_ZASCE|nr:hypothetical protein PRZ48_005753 [Zasmidium cellare]
MSSRTALIAALVAAVSGSIIPRSSEECCFQISASGGVTGTLGQIYDGQNRVGGGYAPATYCLKNGGLFDKNGRGCILTPPTTQWQCDEGAAPTYGFSIGPNGSAQYNGSPEFWACPVNDNGEWNVYTQPVKDQKKCVQISLHTSSQCGAPPPPPPAPPAPPKYEAPPPPPAPKYEQPPPAPKYEQPPPPPQQYAPPPPGLPEPVVLGCLQEPVFFSSLPEPVVLGRVSHSVVLGCLPEPILLSCLPKPILFSCGVKCVSTNGSLALVTPTAKP